MKKIRLLLSALVLPLLMISCHTGDLFYSIEQEVSLEKGIINGTVNSIIRYKTTDNTDLILTSANGVFFKEKSKKTHSVKSQQIDGWAKYNPLTALSYDYTTAKYDGYFISKLAADSSRLYALTYTLKTNDSGNNVIDSIMIFWSETAYADGAMTGDWKEVSGLSLEASDKVNLFCTNAPKTEHRKAFVSVKKADGTTVKLFELNGAVASAKDSWTAADSDAANPLVESAVWFGGDVKLFTTLASISNETESDDPTVYYYGTSNGDIFSSDSAEKKLNTGNPIVSLACTKDSLIIGMGSFDVKSTSINNGGMTHVAITGGTLANSTSDFTTNAGSVFTKYYIVRALLAVYPEKTEDDNILYAATSFKGSGTSAPVTFENIGIWSYNNLRNNWNRD